MFPALCVIALAVLLSGGSVRPCRIFVKFGGFVVIAVRHVRFLKFSSQRERTCQTLSRYKMSRDGVAGMFVVPFGAAGISQDTQRMSPKTALCSLRSW